MQWTWKNYPTAWHGRFKGKEKALTVTLEAICISTLWICHAFFWVPESLNDTNIVEASPIIEKITSHRFPPSCKYIICGKQRIKLYWFTDGIYPKAPFFISFVAEQMNRKKKLMASILKRSKKDIECCFGVLQSKFNFLSSPSRFPSVHTMGDEISCKIILHNMYVAKRERFNVERADNNVEDHVVVGGSISVMWSSLVRLNN